MRSLLCLFLAVATVTAQDFTVCDPDDSSSCSEHASCVIVQQTSLINQTECQCDEGYVGDDCEFRQKNTLTAFLLSLFVGKFGADRFYLEYTDIAIIKLCLVLVPCAICCLFCCASCGLFSIAALSKNEDATEGAEAEAGITGLAGAAQCCSCLFGCAVLIFWLHDWISIAAGDMPDAHGFPLDGRWKDFGV